MQLSLFPLLLTFPSLLTDSFLEDFCCGMKSRLFQDPVPSQSLSNCSSNQSDRSAAEPPHRTDCQPGSRDPGGGGAVGHSENRSVLELKRTKQHYGPSSTSTSSRTAASSHPLGNPSPFAAASGGQTHYPQGPPHCPSPPHPDTDSALEAAVNSILEC